MRMLLVVLIVALLAPVAAWGSNPGEPLDCSDWVILTPGITCTVHSSINTLPDSSMFLRKGSNLQVDNAGGSMAVNFFRVGTTSGCPRCDFGRTEIVRFDGNTEQVIAYLEDRDGATNFRDHLRPRDSKCGNNNCDMGGNTLEAAIRFDAVNGRLIIPLESFCTKVSTGSLDCPADYGGGWWIAAFEGFAPLLEIFQSYTPPSGPISFTVPAHPEGMALADWFDTYYIPMTLPIDFTQAQPLACGFPVSSPDPGDYLTVPDTAPPLQPGQGYFYVTAANYNGERRYGRQSFGGVRTGRDPALLPGCM